MILILTCLQTMLKNASCLCGHFVENAEHFFFHCAKYTNQRIKLFQDLQHIHPINLNTLLFDSSEHNTEVNTHSFVCTQEFLYSKRFGSICSLFSQYFLSSPCPSQSTSFLKYVYVFYSHIENSLLLYLAISASCILTEPFLI